MTLKSIYGNGGINYICTVSLRSLKIMDQLLDFEKNLYFTILRIYLISNHTFFVKVI